MSILAVGGQSVRSWILTVVFTKELLRQGCTSLTRFLVALVTKPGSTLPLYNGTGSANLFSCVETVALLCFKWYGVFANGVFGRFSFFH